ncbi:uncharacterized protein LOC143234129 isoform X3 [Tachypleus tridentatus]|uniref:uncharacterized protein LOC143234129 isoform X3 n=1 Tax=Tachypleus tridentatus TaxID=6853 RepID=UPI003FD5F668
MPEICGTNNTVNYSPLEMFPDFGMQSHPIGPYVNPNITSRFTCDICEKGFARKGDMKRHKIIHSSIRLCFPCHICPKIFTWKISLQRHLKFQHQNL